MPLAAYAPRYFIALLCALLLAPCARATLVATSDSVTLQLKPGEQSTAQKLLLKGGADSVYSSLTLSDAPLGLRYTLEGCPLTQKFEPLANGCALLISYSPVTAVDIKDRLVVAYRTASATTGKDARSESLTIPVWAVGSWPNDSDNDGIGDDDDQCPNTPADKDIDASGCAVSQRDDDGDGVSNAADACPTVQGLRDNGCPTEAQIADALSLAAGSNIQLQNTAVAVAATCTSQRTEPLASDCNALVEAALLGAGGVTEALTAITPDGALLANAALQHSHVAHIRHLSNRLTALRYGARGVSLAGAVKLAYTPADPFFAAMAPGIAPELASEFIPELSALAANADSASESAEPLLLADSRWGLFLSADVSRSNRNGAGFGAAFDGESVIVTGGLDYRVSPTTVLGAALSQAQSDSKLTQRAGFLEQEQVTVTAFGSYAADHWYMDAALAMGSSNMEQERGVNYTLSNSTPVSQRMHARYGGSMTSGYIAVGWQGGIFGGSYNQQDVDLDSNQESNQGANQNTNFASSREASAWGLNVGMSLDYVRSKIDAFSELPSDPNAAGAGWAVTVAGQSQRWLTGRLASTLSRVLHTSWGVWVPYAELELVHEFANNPYSVNTQFVGDPDGPALAVLSERPDHNYLRGRFGASLQLPRGVAGFIDYGRLMSANRWEGYTVSAGLRVAF